MKAPSLLLILSLIFTPTFAQNETNASTLRNGDILQMVKAQVAPEVIIAKIRSSRCNFDTFPGVISELKHKGVPDSVLLAMVEAPVGKAPPKKAPAPTADVAEEEAAQPKRQTVTLEDGTDFSVTLQQEVHSKDAVTGDPVRLRVDEDVRVDGHIVIKRGTLVKGFVSSSDDNGMMGKGGRVGVRIETTKAVDGQVVRLRAAKGKSEGTATGKLVLNYVLFGPLGFLTRGKNARIKEGTRLNVFVDEDKEIVLPVAKK